MCCLFGIMDNNESLTGKQKTKLIRALAAESEASAYAAQKVQLDRR